MGTVATIQNTLCEVLPWNLERGKRPLIVLLVVSTVAYLVGLLLTTYVSTFRFAFYNYKKNCYIFLEIMYGNHNMI